MDTWWNFLWIPRCFSRSFLVKALSNRPSIRCSSNICEYWGSPQSLIHLCATQVWSTTPHLGYFLKVNGTSHKSIVVTSEDVTIYIIVIWQGRIPDPWLRAKHLEDTKPKNVKTQGIKKKGWTGDGENFRCRCVTIWDSIAGWWLQITFVPVLSVLQWLTAAYVCAKVSEY